MKSKRLIFAMGAASLIVVAAALAQTSKPPPARGPASIKELMTLIVEPTSTGVFRVASEAPKNDAEWKTLQGQALTLLEVANSLTTAARAKDQKQWMQDAKLFKDSSKIAFAAAMAKNVEALSDLNDPLYTACANCHEHYLPKR
jgi:hypothetical protein